MGRLRRFLCRLLRCHAASASAGGVDEPEGVRGFNESTVYILGKLYGSFPEPLDFNMLREVVSAAVMQESPARSLDQAPLRAKYITPTMRWLANHGYVEVGSTYLDGNYGDVELTEKAFKALELVPSAIRPALVEKPKSLGSLMRDAAVSHSMGAAGDLVKALLAS